MGPAEQTKLALEGKAVIREHSEAGLAASLRAE